MTRRDLIREYERINRKFELRFEPSVRRSIHAKVIRAANIVKTQGVTAGINYLHMDISNPDMEKAVANLYEVVGMYWARIEYSRMFNENGRKAHITGMITKGFGFSQLWHDFIQNYFKHYLLEVITYDVATTTRDALLKILITANASGWGIDKTVDAIRDWPGERYQAARVVRTEVNRAANVGHKANSDTLSYQQNKEWVSAEDHRVRGTSPKDHADHVALDRVTIDADDHFVDSRNGDRLMFPGDVKASAASTINCRCRAVYTAKRDAQGNLVPKRVSTTVIFPNQPKRPEPILI